MWAQVARWVVSTIITILLTPKPETPKPASLGGFDVPVVKEGRELPLIGGTVWIDDPQIAWYGDLKTKAIKSSGGKK